MAAVKQIVSRLKDDVWYSLNVGGARAGLPTARSLQGQAGYRRWPGPPRLLPLWQWRDTCRSTLSAAPQSRLWNLHTQFATTKKTRIYTPANTQQGEQVGHLKDLQRSPPFGMK